MKVSFIIPSFNQGRFIRDTLDGILAQGLQRGDYEVLVFDGGSTDGTLEVLKSHPVSCDWVSRPDNGQADAINAGFKKARGDIIAWVNSDDWYQPGALAAVLEVFARPAAPLVVYGRAVVTDIAGVTLHEYPVRPWDYTVLGGDCFLCQPAVFFRREVIDEFGLLDVSLHYAMDYEYWLRIGKGVPFHFLNRVLAASRSYPETKSLRDKPGVFLDGLRVSLRHTGRANRRWIRGLGYWRAKTACESAGTTSPWILALRTFHERAAIRLRLFLGNEP